MNTINFINEKIKETKRSVEHWKELLKRYPNNKEIYTRCLNTLEIELQVLQQIKTELEAWYIVEPYIEIIYKNTPNPYWNTKPMYDECKLKDTNILIKAKSTGGEIDESN